MNGKILRLGLIGKDVSKSHSPQIHSYILKAFGYDCLYEKLSVSAEDFDMAMRRLLGDCDGFNVTIPYKRDVLEYLDEVKGDALACGAVNTVVCATRAGYNTDGVGFLDMLQANGVETKGKRILILGAGGAGRSSAVALKNAGASVFMYRRNKAELLETCEQLGVEAANASEEGGFDIVINSTGVGMHDTVGVSPVTKKAFAGATWAIDLIYEPAESAFLRIAKSCGLQTLNGEAMLFYQAYHADCVYLQKTPNPLQAKALYESYTKGERL